MQQLVQYTCYLSILIILLYNKINRDVNICLIEYYFLDINAYSST